jgi:hypothetical protein
MSKKKGKRKLPKKKHNPPARTINTTLATMIGVEAKKENKKSLAKNPKANRHAKKTIEEVHSDSDSQSSGNSDNNGIGRNDNNAAQEVADHTILECMMKQAINDFSPIIAYKKTVMYWPPKYTCCRTYAS